MVSLKLQARLAGDVLGVGRGRVWLDPNEASEIAQASSRKAIRKLVKDGFIIRKPVKVHTRARWRKMQEAKAMGRHEGRGRREGTREARMPSKDIWMRRLRILRRMLRKYRKERKIDSRLYRELYLKAKGNVFKNKRNLMEHIHVMKDEKKKEAQLKEEAEAKELKDAAQRDKARKKELKKRDKATKAAKDAADKAAKEAAEKAKKVAPKAGAKLASPVGKPGAKTVAAASVSKPGVKGAAVTSAPQAAVPAAKVTPKVAAPAAKVTPKTAVPAAKVAGKK